MLTDCVQFESDRIGGCFAVFLTAGLRMCPGLWLPRVFSCADRPANLASTFGSYRGNVRRCHFWNGTERGKKRENTRVSSRGAGKAGQAATAPGPKAPKVRIPCFRRHGRWAAGKIHGKTRPVSVVLPVFVDDGT